MHRTAWNTYPTRSVSFFRSRYISLRFCAYSLSASVAAWLVVLESIVGDRTGSDVEDWLEDDLSEVSRRLFLNIAEGADVPHHRRSTQLYGTSYWVPALQTSEKVHGIPCFWASLGAW